MVHPGGEGARQSHPDLRQRQEDRGLPRSQEHVHQRLPGTADARSHRWRGNHGAVSQYSGEGIPGRQEWEVNAKSKKRTRIKKRRKGRMKRKEQDRKGTAVVETDRMQD